MVAVGGSGVGSDLLERAVEAHVLLAARVERLRTILIAGPRIDPSSFEVPDGVELLPYVHAAGRMLAASDAALVQGGLTTTMELVAAGRPFVSVPLRRHFEQNGHVAHRLRRYGHERQVDADASPAAARRRAGRRASDAGDVPAGSHRRGAPRGGGDRGASLVRRPMNRYSIVLRHRTRGRPVRIARIAWLDASSGDSEITVAGTLESGQSLAQRIGAERALAVGQMVLLVAVRVGDVGEVDVERRARREDVVDRIEGLDEQARFEVGAVARRVHVREVEHGAHPAGPARDLDDVVERAEIADTPHHLDAEGNGPILSFQTLAQRAELLDDRGDRVLPRAAEQEAGVEDDDLGAAGRRDPRTAIEGADRRGELPARSPRDAP